METILTRIHPDDQPRFRAAIEGLRDPTASTFSVSGRVVRPDGNVHPSCIFVQVVRGTDGTPERALCWRALPFGVRDEPESYLKHGGWTYDPKTGVLLASDATNRSLGLECGVPHPRSAYRHEYFAEDCAREDTLLNEVAEGRIESATLTLRTLASGGSDECVVTIHGIRGPRGDVVEVVGFNTRLQSHSPVEKPAAPRVRIGFWAKNLRSDTFIVPDWEFCHIYKVDRNSPTLDQDIRSHYKPEDSDAAYEFIADAVAEGRNRGFHSFTLHFEDGSEQEIRLEFFVECDEDGPVRMSGAVVAVN